MFRLCVSGCAWVVLGCCFGHGFRLRFRLGCADFSADFSVFSFCSSSLVLMGTVGLCSDFYGFDSGCGCALVDE